MVFIVAMLVIVSDRCDIFDLITNIDYFHKKLIL